MTQFELHQGDCLEVMKTLPDNSVDSIVTDPPYELGFMGKAWDKSGIAYNVELWREVYRVLKPGAHLLAFGSSRGHHRMFCAIEDAGFEIRDTITWLFGSGFPKSLNVSKNLQGLESVCKCDEHNGDLLSLRSDISDLEGVAEAGQNPDLFKEMQRETTRGGVGDSRPQRASRVDKSEQSIVSDEDVRAEQSSVEGRSYITSSQGKLCPSTLSEMPAGTVLDGSEGRLRHGASSSHGEMDRSAIDTQRNSSSHRPQTSKQPSNESGTLAGQPIAQTSGTWPLCSRCGQSIIPDGLGTALKPAAEYIVMARKPLEKGLTVAQNVLKWGTGAINIDKCPVLW